MASTLLTAPPAPQSLPMDHQELDAARALLGVSPNENTTNNSGSAIGAAKATDVSATTMTTSSEDFPFRKRQRSDSAGLDALAALASQEQMAAERNSSNMKKQQQVTFSDEAPAITSSSSEDNDEDEMPPPPSRFRCRPRSASNPEGMEKYPLVLPASILESELAEANAAVREQERRSPGEQNNADGNNNQMQEEVDESTLTPDELLRRARSRLLEDLSEGTVNGEKGVLTLPHALSKYKEVYNKNGRIGIYTPSERAAIIARFNRKRSRRVWNKKIRYNCRKSLADRRLRVKGRFVKRSEQEQLRKLLEEKKEAAKDKESCEMPDVTDPEAGFAPTEDQPYRRVRRYTIS